MSKDKSHLRFAALIRVSTEKQERTGESLRTQRTEIEKVVEQFSGTIVEWYGGQEHATPGYEKKEIDRLLCDAEKQKFDAVIVANADRWSRDNDKSREGLELFKEHKIRFFVGSTEYDLFNPESLLFLGMSAVIGQFQAQLQNKKSIENRIHRARRGVPACGKLPFGRTFDRATEKWAIDEKKRIIIEDIAERYLASEPLSKLAEEYNLNHSNLHKILTKRCGDKWDQEFHSEDSNIHAIIETAVPRLLSDETIKAIKRKAEANKTFQHGQAKHRYLFGRVIFCGHCGYTMFGQTDQRGHRYYRHAHQKRIKECNSPKIWVRAEEVEKVAMRHLFECFGNPQAVQRAIEEATPNLEKVREFRERRKNIEAEQRKTKAAREKILRLICKDLLSEAEAEKKLEELKQTDAKHQAELDRLNDSLENVHTPESIKTVSEEIASNVLLNAKIRCANRLLDEMTWDESRALVEIVFSGRRQDGSRMGIFIEWLTGQEKRRRKKWKYTICGHLIQQQGKFPMSKSAFDPEYGANSEFGSPGLQQELVTKYASCSPGTSPPARRWRVWPGRPPG